MIFKILNPVYYFKVLIDAILHPEYVDKWLNEKTVQLRKVHFEFCKSKYLDEYLKIHGSCSEEEFEKYLENKIKKL